VALVKKRIEKEYLVCDVCGTEVREIEDEDGDSYFKDFCRKCKKGLCPQCLTPIGFAITERQSLGYHASTQFNQWFCIDCAGELIKHLEEDWGIKAPDKVSNAILNAKLKVHEVESDIDIG